MSSVNKCMLVGRAGSDPDVSHTPNGTAKAVVSIATDETWKDRDGNKQKETDWHRCVAWGKLAEIWQKWLKKGSLVYIEGPIKHRSWEKDGQKHYMTELVVKEFKFLPSGQGSNGGGQSDGGGYQSSSGRTTSPPDFNSSDKVEKPSFAGAPPQSTEDDDVPF